MQAPRFCRAYIPHARDVAKGFEAKGLVVVHVEGVLHAHRALVEHGTQKVAGLVLDLIGKGLICCLEKLVNLRIVGGRNLWTSTP